MNLSLSKNKSDINICRICLESEQMEDTVDIFSNSNEAKSILEKIYSCFQISISFQLDFPRYICHNCLSDLNAAHNFRMKCLTFNERISQKLKCNQNQRLLPENVKFQFCENLHDGVNMAQDSNISEYHLINHKQVDFVGLKCPHCGKVLKTKPSFMKHILSMHQKRKHIGKVTGFGATRQYHCTLCSYSTPHSQTLVNHIQKHEGKRPYGCHCGKNFTQSSALAAHLKTHSDTTYFTCTKCGKQFKHAYSLKRHLTVHEDGSFVCYICQKVLKTNQSLQEHTQRHYNIRNFSCEDCGKTFVTSSELIHHRSKHSSDKKLECHLCGYRTQAKKSLILHLKRHSGHKTFKCDHCEVTFYTRGEACRHQRVHTREKPFSCPTCSQRFAYSPSLNKHMLMVHCIQFKWGESKNKNVKCMSQVANIPIN